jgi:hypothetical protein
LGLPSEEVAVVVQIQAISQRTSQQAAQVFRERAARLRAGVAERLAEEIVANSPVDTGTYIMAHKAGTGESSESATRSSARKRRGRNASQFANLALGNLKRSVSADALLNSSEIWFRNSALHAARVEYLGWPAPVFGNPKIGGPGPYRVYARARAKAPQFIREVAAQLGMETR